MTHTTDTTRAWSRSGLRKAMWATAALLLALPAVAMRFTAEVNWDETDFIVMGLLLAATCGAIDLGMRMSGSLAYRAGIVVAVGGGFLLLWVNMAVGILGGEDNAANLLYLGVLAVGALGALVARFRARGLMRTMFAMAAAQVLGPLIALASGSAGSGPSRIVGVTLFFLGPWLLAAALFHFASRDDAAHGAAA